MPDLGHKGEFRDRMDNVGTAPFHRADIGS